MEGIFGKMFDFNGDGELDPFEQAAELDFLEEMNREDRQKEEYQNNDGPGDEREDELEAAGIDSFDFSFMDDDEKRKTLEEAGLDPSDFDLY